MQSNGSMTGSAAGREGQRGNPFCVAVNTFLCLYLYYLWQWGQATAETFVVRLIESFSPFSSFIHGIIDFCYWQDNWGALFERDPTATWVTSSNQAQWHYESAIISSFIMKWNYYWIHTIDVICGDIRDVIKLNIKLTMISDCRHDDGWF